MSARWQDYLEDGIYQIYAWDRYEEEAQNNAQHIKERVHVVDGRLIETTMWLGDEGYFFQHRELVPTCWDGQVPF